MRFAAGEMVLFARTGREDQNHELVAQAALTAFGAAVVLYQGTLHSQQGYPSVASRLGSLILQSIFCSLYHGLGKYSAVQICGAISQLTLTLAP